MNRIKAIEFLQGYCIRLHFQDGKSKVVDFEPLIGKGVSAPLLDVGFFRLAAIDDGGGLEWPNGMDFCPNFLKEYTADLVSTL